MKQRYNYLQSLRDRGFDESEHIPFTKHYRIRCSQCEALSINEMACHETGCPNIVPTCEECGNLDPKKTCCTEFEII